MYGFPYGSTMPQLSQQPTQAQLMQRRKHSWKKTSGTPSIPPPPPTVNEPRLERPHSDHFLFDTCSIVSLPAAKSPARIPLCDITPSQRVMASNRKDPLITTSKTPLDVNDTLTTERQHVSTTKEYKLSSSCQRRHYHQQQQQQQQQEKRRLSLSQDVCSVPPHRLQPVTNRRFSHPENPQQQQYYYYNSSYSSSLAGHPHYVSHPTKPHHQHPHQHPYHPPPPLSPFIHLQQQQQQHHLSSPYEATYFREEGKHHRRVSTNTTSTFASSDHTPRRFSSGSTNSSRSTFTSMGSIMTWHNDMSSSSSSSSPSSSSSSKSSSPATVPPLLTHLNSNSNTNQRPLAVDQHQPDTLTSSQGEITAKSTSPVSPPSSLSPKNDHTNLAVNETLKENDTNKSTEVEVVDTPIAVRDDCDNSDGNGDRKRMESTSSCNSSNSSRNVIDTTSQGETSSAAVDQHVEHKGMGGIAEHSEDGKIIDKSENATGIDVDANSSVEMKAKVNQLSSPPVETVSLAADKVKSSASPTSSSSPLPLLKVETAAAQTPEKQVEERKENEESIPIWADPIKIRDNPTRYKVIKDYMAEHKLPYTSVLPLHRHAVFYFSDTSKSKTTTTNYRSSMQQLCICETVWEFSSFWRRYKEKQGKVSQMALNQNLYCFQNGVEPMWEDKVNKDGGRLTLCPSKGISLDDLFDWILCSFVGGNLAMHGMVGLVVSKRARIDRIELWLDASCSSLESVSSLRNKLLKYLPIGLHEPVISSRYKKHYDR